MSARLLVTRSLVSQCRGFRAARNKSRNRHGNYPWQCRAAVTNAFGQGTRIETGRTSNHTAVVDSDPSISDYRTGICMTEIELPLPDGMVIRGQRWSNFQQQQQQQQSKEGNGLGQDTAKTIKILALHGWLDNCRSFHYLAPKLLEKFQQTGISTNTEASFAAAELVAVDLPGHGWSSHRPIDGPTVLLSEGAYYIAEIIDALGWGESDDNDNDSDDNTSENDASGDHKVALIGHSMGGSMAVTYAGVFPEAISKVVSIDIYGPEPGTPQTALQNIRSHVSQRQQWGPKGRPHALYPSLQKAIARRQKAATLAPGGHQYLSLEAATEMVTRSMEPVYDEREDNEHEDASSSNNNRVIRGYKFKHDARLLWPSLQYLTVEQIQSILERVECPVCLVGAHDGYPFDQDRIDRVVQTLQPQVHEILPGSHHLHADPDTADAVVDLLYDFLGGEHSDKATGGKEGNARSSNSSRDDSQSVDNYGMQ